MCSISCYGEYISCYGEYLLTYVHGVSELRELVAYVCTYNMYMHVVDTGRKRTLAYGEL